MSDGDWRETASASFVERFGRPPTVAAYAPGRVEVLGNHTDYNEGFVLSAAIDLGTLFLVAQADGTGCGLVAGNFGEEATFEVAVDAPAAEQTWANYVRGVLCGLRERGMIDQGFNAWFEGDIPLGAGLSSSASLEIAAGLALCALYGLDVDKLDLARIGQAAEHRFVGAKCGLLDQISSLFGEEHALVMTDFRSLAVGNVPLGIGPGVADACFLMCNTNVKHSLVASEYNERRERCEAAALFFAAALDHPVAALRDVSWAEWEAHEARMDPVTARRAAHVIGENTRVLRGRELLAGGELGEFGQLMFESHESSRRHFENSCPELDFLVDTARKIPGALGARLSGGGFGGSAVVLTHPRDAETVGPALAAAYGKQFGRACEVRVIRPSCGARVLS